MKPIKHYLATAALILWAATSQADGTKRAFQNGWNAVSFEAARYTGTQEFDSNMTGIRAGYGQYFRDNLGFWLELNAMRFEYAGEHKDRGSVTGIGITPILRWHPIQYGAFSAFADIGLGVALTESRYPIFGDDERGTYLNTTPQLALGATWQIDENYFIKAGWRYYHLSNGDIYGEERNPGHDSDGYFLGGIMRWD